MLKLTIVCCLLSVALAGTDENLPPRLDGRIVGGTPTTISAHKHQVSVQFRGYHICGGSIIKNDTVLTAAHCMAYVNSGTYSIRAGSSNHSSGGTVYRVKSTITHSKYNEKTYDYDYALMKIEGAFNLTDMSSINLECGNVADGAAAVVTGWGTTRENGNSSPGLLQVNVPIVKQSLCKDSYGSGSITNRMICAGYTTGGRDACQGDSGGPLVVNGKLVGIVSWGNGCARPDYPGVYSRVSDQCSWIEKNSSIKQAAMFNMFIFLLITVILHSY